MTSTRTPSRSLLLAAMLAALSLPACADVILDDAGPAPAREHREMRNTRPDIVHTRSVSTLQIGCDDPEAGAPCRRASTSVEIGTLSRSNEARNGVAIQETLIGTGR